MSEVAEVEEVEAVIEDTEEVVQEEVSQEVEEVVEEEEVADQPDEEGAEEVEITLGDESLTSNEEEEKAPDWVRNLRAEYKETKKQNRELLKRLEEKEAQATQQGPITLGPQPKLEDFDYDEDKLKAATEAWYAKKFKLDQEKAQAEAEQQRQAQEWEKRVQEYESSKKELGVPDYQDSEDIAMDTFDQAQQGLILHGMDNPALVVYALGKNPDRAKELAQIKDPVKFVSAVAKIEGQLKVTKRKAKPQPEKQLKGSSGNAGGVDSTLERLRAEADRTGNRTKVVAYLRKQKAKQLQ